MKKLLLIVFLLLGFNCFAQDVDISTVYMPTDEEIRETLDKFDFNDKQKEYLFKELKRKFEDMYLENLYKTDKTDKNEQ